jgi:DNA-binding LacI/PurR family transcriptional regulator
MNVGLIPVITWILNQPEITAVLASNDWQGRKLHTWLTDLGVRVPEEISLLSFDNYRSKYWHPLTSVDFGFDSLGYAAFHTILGDIPIKHDRKGNIKPVARVVHKGSVGGGSAINTQSV